MTTSPDASASVLRRDREAGWIGGVAAGIARRFGIDVSLVRLAFVVATAAGGVGLAAYALGWLLIPAGDSARRAVRIRTGRAAVEVALGTGLLLLAVLLTFRALGIWFSDAVVWPLVLIAGGGALLWRQSMGEPAEPRPRASAADAHSARASRTADGRTQGSPREEPPSRLRAISRTGLGIALVIAAGFVFLQATGALGAARDVVLAVIVAVVVLGVIFAPWIVRLVRSLTQERAERIRSQERAEMAAHLHDSVLQTLAMVQRSAGDPPRWPRSRAARSASCARGSPAGPRPARRARSRRRSRRLPPRWRSSHGVPVEVVVVGDRDLDAGARGGRRGRSRGHDERREVRRRLDGGRVRRERRLGARRCSCATADRASTPPPCPGTAAACASRSSAGWSATAAARA